ncbi:hypothetical protein C1H46_019482 [Malus baccata]|uniref:Uncharacterized protein n=1 Tax=Malus baccata TaxID=106549 RepID=A0A540M891_MALBA|nr:hypothetical protein C1H46_019482 [Malus baccata]
MFFVEFVCRVPLLSLAWVFQTPPRSPWCLPFPAILLGNFSELHIGGWPLLFGCQLPLVYDCVQEASKKEMIDGGRRIDCLEASRISGGESGGCFSDVLSFFGPLGFFMFLFLFCGF